MSLCISNHMLVWYPSFSRDSRSLWYSVGATHVSCNSRSSRHFRPPAWWHSHEQVSSWCCSLHWRAYQPTTVACAILGSCIWPSSICTTGLTDKACTYLALSHLQTTLNLTFSCVPSFMFLCAFSHHAQPCWEHNRCCVCLNAASSLARASS